MPNKRSFNKKLLEEVLVFFMLVAIGVVGRWGQPDWCFTPTAAVGVFAGFYFARIEVAVFVPLAVLAISDLALPAYNSQGVMVTVHLALMLPVLLGFSLKTLKTLKTPSGAAAAALSGPNKTGTGTSIRSEPVPVLLGVLKFAACGLVPATLFFFLSNWAVWQFQSDYEPTLAGLTACYAAAVPFYRAMLMGDVFYVAVIFGCYALAMTYLRRPSLQPVTARADRS